MPETKTKSQKTTKATEVASSPKYIEAIGRRKSAVARVRIFEEKTVKSSFFVNNKDVSIYFPTEEMGIIAREALGKVKALSKFNVSVRVQGGGIHAQAEALRHGLARSLVAYNEEWRKRLKKGGFLKRDPRMVERKKFGKKKARKSPQWSKR